MHLQLDQILLHISQLHLHEPGCTRIQSPMVVLYAVFRILIFIFHLLWPLTDQQVQEYPLPFQLDHQ